MPKDTSDHMLFVCRSRIQTTDLVDKQTLSAFKNKTIDPLFKSFKDGLNQRLEDSVAPYFYEPIHFVAFGHFNLISLALVDDSHFGNFFFRPYNTCVDEDGHSFGYQISNGYNPESGKNIRSLLETIGEYNFLAVTKLKLHKNYFFDDLNSVENIKIQILGQSPNVATIVSESMSWFELLVVTATDCLSKLIKSVVSIREMPQDKCETSELKHMFVDSHTSYGFNSNFLDEPGNFKEKIKYYTENYSTNERDLTIFSRISLKTGHGNRFLFLLKRDFETMFDWDSISTMDGDSDLFIRYGNGSFLNYLDFWRALKKEVVNDENVCTHIRTFHSNVGLRANGSINEYPTLDVSDYNNFTKELSFSRRFIQNLDKCCQKLRLSKDLANRVHNCFLAMNSALTDRNLFRYFLDLVPLLNQLAAFIEVSAKQVGTAKENNDYISINALSNRIQMYLSIWKTGYSNRFLDSKKIRYNNDFKQEFNGGVHQILQRCDAVYKMIHGSVRKKEELFCSLSLPCATYGNNELGIRSSEFRLNLDYFQLFNPEFFLFTCAKEAFNHLEREYKIKINDNDFVDLENFNSFLKTNIIELTYRQPALEHKYILLNLLPPDLIEERVDYFLLYSMFYQWNFLEHTELFVFWFVFNYLQSSESYNADGSFNSNALRINLFALFVVLKLEDKELDLLDIISESPNCPYLVHFMNMETNSSVKTIYSLREEFTEAYSILESDQDIFNSLHNLHDAARRMVSDNEKYVFFAQVTTFKKFQLSKLVEMKDILSINVKNKVKTQSGQVMTYLRNGSGEGKKMVDDQRISYCNGVFDPTGGIFLMTNESRLKMMKCRYEIYQELQIYSKEVVRNLKKGLENS